MTRDTVYNAKGTNTHSYVQSFAYKTVFIKRMASSTRMPSWCCYCFISCTETLISIDQLKWQMNEKEKIRSRLLRDRYNVYSAIRLLWSNKEKSCSRRRQKKDRGETHAFKIYSKSYCIKPAPTRTKSTELKRDKKHRECLRNGRGTIRKAEGHQIGFTFY